MKKLKLLTSLFLLVVLSILVLPEKTYALADTDELIRRVAPDGENVTLKSIIPTTDNEIYMMIPALFEKAINNTDYNISVSCDSTNTNCTVAFQTEDYNFDYQTNTVISGIRNEYDVKVTYEQPSNKNKDIVMNYYSNLKDIDFADYDTYYTVTDLSLINYYLTGDKSELWNVGAGTRALKFSDMNKMTKGSNLSYYLYGGMGSEDASQMYEYMVGELVLLHNDYAYGVKTEGIYLKRVIYIPEDTEESTNAYKNAAQKRINDYLGNDSVTVSYGGKLSELEAINPDSLDPTMDLPEIEDYYNITVGTRTYKFYILKGTSDKLVEPSYKTKDIDSKIEITSDDSSIPLDATVTVKNVNDASIKDKIGTENYVSYDITLYSDAISDNIEKLENGKFLVRIPVPEELKGKSLIVYYITTDKKVEEHKVTLSEDDEYITFETDHFSVYTLAEKQSTTDTSSTSTDNSSKESTTQKEQTVTNPSTGDNITLYVVTLILSISIITGIVIYIKKKKKN